MRRLAVFLALSGCSFAFVTGPPANHAQLSYFDCTTSHLAPVLDTVLTGLMVLDEVALGTDSDADWAKSNGCNTGDPNCPAISRHGGMLLDGAIGIAGAAGMIYGWTKTSACRQAKAEQMARQQPYTPGSWPPPQGASQGNWPPPGAPQPAPRGTWPPPQQPMPPQAPPQPPSPPAPPPPAQ